jgi:septum formation protein
VSGRTPASARPHHGEPLPKIVLASASPRRTDLLGRLRLPHAVDPSSIDESVRPAESAGDRVARLAVEKAEAVRDRHPGAWVIGGDTEVVLDGTSLGKPADAEDARRMLGRLSGRGHLVLSSVALVRPHAAPDVEVVATRVHVRALAGEVIDGYVATGEPLDKAGGYGIQGLGSTLVERIDGDYTAVVGLPIGALVRLLERAGLVWSFGDGWRVDPEASEADLDREGDA